MNRDTEEKKAKLNEIALHNPIVHNILKYNNRGDCTFEYGLLWMVEELVKQNDAYFKELVTYKRRYGELK